MTKKLRQSTKGGGGGGAGVTTGVGVGMGVGVTGVALGVGEGVAVGMLVGLMTVTEKGVPACATMTNDWDERAGSLLTVICSSPLRLSCNVVVATPLVVTASMKSG